MLAIEPMLTSSISGNVRDLLLLATLLLLELALSLLTLNDLALLLDLLLLLPFPNGCKERLEVYVEVVLSDAEIPIEKKQELLLHQVDFGRCETEAIISRY